MTKRHVVKLMWLADGLFFNIMIVELILFWKSYFYLTRLFWSL